MGEKNVLYSFPYSILDNQIIFLFYARKYPCRDAGHTVFAETDTRAEIRYALLPRAHTVQEMVYTVREM